MLFLVPDGEGRGISDAASCPLPRGAGGNPLPECVSGSQLASAPRESSGSQKA